MNRQTRGKRGETLAVWRLRLSGWRIVARNLRLPQGEIDVIARRGRVLAFIEVKTRADPAQAAEAILVRQRQRIARAAQAFLARRPDLAELDIRFDAVLVAPWPRHVANAWDAG